MRKRTYFVETYEDDQWLEVPLEGVTDVATAVKAIKGHGEPGRYRVMAICREVAVEVEKRVRVSE